MGGGVLGVALLVVGFVLSVVGLALIAWPAALTFVGVLLMGAGLFVDFDRDGE